MRQPGSVADWVDVALERVRDAGALKRQNRVLAAVYMLGYGVECTLKGFVRRKAKPKNIHDLRELLECAGFKSSDVQPDWRDFMNRWMVSMRYTCRLDPSVDGVVLFDRGLSLFRFLHRRLRRERRRVR